MAFASLIDNKSLILLPHHQTLIPSLSPDIMMPTQSTQCTLKLATTLSTSMAGKLDNSDDMVLLTRWIDSLLAKTNYYQNTLFICKNLESMSAYDQTLSECNRVKLLFGLYQNPLHKIRQDQRAVPLPALLTDSLVAIHHYSLKLLKLAACTQRLISLNIVIRCYLDNCIYC